MPNVDKELHNPETTNGNLIKERTTSKPKRGLRGAAGGTYIGPVLSTAAIGDSSITHATGAAGGGVEDSTGYRESDTYNMGTDVAAATATVRSTGRSLYRADGVQGGSVPGYPAQRVGQKAAASSGSGLTAEGQAAAFIDKRSNIYGDGGVALGSAGRGTRVIAGTVATSNVGQTSGAPRMTRPTYQAGANPASGVVTIAGGAGKVTSDLHADDITGGANGRAGVVIYVFAKGTDTDEDAALVAKGDFDTNTAGDVTGLTGLTAGDYAVYAAFKDAAGNIGPWGARTLVTVT